MSPVPSPAISSSLFFLVPFLLLVLAFQPSSTRRPSMVPPQLIQTLIAILAVLVATLGLASLYKAEMVVEALFVFVLQSTVVYIIISVSSFSQYAIALIVLLSSATLFSFLSILVQLPAVLNYLSPILFVAFCLVAFKILFQLIFPNRPRRPISLPKADQLYSISLDTVESGVFPAQDNPLKTILLVSFSSQFLFLLFCILRLSSLAQDTPKQWALKTAQTILLILSSLCSTYAFSQYACHQGLQHGDQKHYGIIRSQFSRMHPPPSLRDLRFFTNSEAVGLRLAAGPSGAFKTVNGLCSTSSGTSDAHDASAAVHVSGSLEASKASIISDASINSTVSIASDASDANKRAYTNINSYSKHDNDNDSATLSSSPSVSVPGSLSPQSRWSRFIALASRPATSMASMASLAPSAATDTAAISEVCTRVNSRFTLDIGRSSTFPSSIPSIPSISSSRSTIPSIHSIDSNPSVFGSINTLYTLPNDALSYMDITTSATGVTGASPVMITATPFLHPATATLSNSQNSHYVTTLADKYGMTADYRLVEYADEGSRREASFPDQSLCPLSRDLNPHITYSTNQDRVLASEVSLDAVVTAIPLLHPATTTFQTSQDKAILAYKHDMTANYADNVASYGTVRYIHEGVAPIPDQTSCPLSRGLAPHLTCLTNQNRVLATDVSLDVAAATTTLDFDSGRAHLIGHKESMHSLTSFSSTSSSSSSSTTTLGISTTTSMQSMHERTVSWSSSSVALPGSGRRNVAMKMKMTGGVPLGKCVPLDVLSRNFLQDEDEVETESPVSLTPDSEFSPRLDDSEYPSSKRTKSRGSWGRSMSATAAFEMDNASYNLPDVAEEDVKKKSRSGSAFLFGGWGRVRGDDHTQDQEQVQEQGRGHRRQRSRGLSLSIGRVMKGRSLSISLLSGWMKSRSKKDDDDDDDETQRVLGGDSMPSSETPSLFFGSGWGSGSPMFSSLSLTGMAGSKAAINTSRSTLVTTSSGTTPNASPSSTPTSQGKKAGWKTIQGKKSCSMMMDDTHHRPADFMDMRDPFAPPVLGLRARTSPS
ncbi:hypothetical protein M378DRAFT_199616, partial [Amanita muscaria Koide BX008]